MRADFYLLQIYLMMFRSPHVQCQLLFVIVLLSVASYDGYFSHMIEIWEKRAALWNSPRVLDDLMITKTQNATGKVGLSILLHSFSSFLHSHERCNSRIFSLYRCASFLCTDKLMIVFERCCQLVVRRTSCIKFLTTVDTLAKSLSSSCVKLPRVRTFQRTLMEICSGRF